METGYRVCACLVTCAVVWAGGENVARACSPLMGYVMRVVVPRDGDIAVPTNLRVVVYYEDDANRGFDLDDHPTLQSMDGAIVPTRLGRAGEGFLLLTPLSPLQPNAQYRVFSEVLQVPCMTRPGMSSVSMCTGIDGGAAFGGGATIDGGATVDGGTGTSPTPVATFATGDGPDLSAPILGGSLSAASHALSCSNSACCGPYRPCYVELTWNPADDKGNSVYYQLFSRDGLLLPILWTPRAAGQLKYGPFAHDSRFIAQPGKFKVVAVDCAGNSSAPIVADVANTCDEGCSCRINRSSRGGFRWIALGAFAFFAWRRRSHAVRDNARDNR